MNFINIVSVSFVGLMKTGNLLEEINFIALVTIIFPQSSPMQTQRPEDFTQAKCYSQCKERKFKNTRQCKHTINFVISR